jgi:hypothetical protein
MDNAGIPAGEGLVVRSYREGDEYAINEMFNEVFGQTRDLSHWYWRYRDNPWGSHIISISEAADGTPAAHYAGTPMRVYSSFSGEKAPSEFTVYHIGDKMTRRRFRGIGRGKSSVLAKTVEHFCATYCRGQIPFYYGFLTHHSLRFGLLFLDYKTIEPVPRRFTGIGELQGTYRRSLGDVLASVTVCETREVDERWSDFFEEAAPYYGYLVRRDHRYLRWRYLNRPDREYLFLTVMRRNQVAAWSVFYREGTRIIWGDALFHPRHPGLPRLLIGYLKGHPLCRGAESLEGWFPSRPEWSDALIRGLGFQRAADPHNLQFTRVAFADDEIDGPLKKHFYYTLGDSDLF